MTTNRLLHFDADRVATLLTVLERMAAGDTRERLPISLAHDELDAVAHGINAMIGELGWASTRIFEMERERAATAERALAENALRESEERFRRIARTAPVMIWITDVSGQVTYANQAYLDFTGVSLDAVLGPGWVDVTHPDDVERCRAVFVKALSERGPLQVEQRLRRYDGEYRWTVTNGVPQYHGDGSFAGYIGTAIDIMERKLAEQALSTISQRLIDAHEEERAHLARELHDDVNQRLGLLALRLDGIVSNSPVSPTHLTEQIVRAREEIGTLITDMQALAHRLHPPRLNLLGLTASVAALCREVGDQHGITIHFQAERIPSHVPLRLSLCLYRVLQEALQNAIKHSGVSEIDVSLRCDVDQIELTVRDSGNGFNANDGMTTNGIGLTSMQERVKAVAGQLIIASTPGLGTTIQARVPTVLHGETQGESARASREGEAV
jgi:PAS domain S-box-containing protein